MFEYLSNKALFEPNKFPIRKNSYHDKGYGACDDFIMGAYTVVEFVFFNDKIED